MSRHEKDNLDIKLESLDMNAKKNLNMRTLNLNRKAQKYGIELRNLAHKRAKH